MASPVLDPRLSEVLADSGLERNFTDVGYRSIPVEELASRVSAMRDAWKQVQPILAIIFRERANANALAKIADATARLKASRMRKKVPSRRGPGCQAMERETPGT